MTETPRIRAAWRQGDLHKALITFLPAFVDKPFDDEPTISVRRICEALNTSHETVYKWLRNGRLRPSNATLLRELSECTENRKALRAAGRTPPKVRDFDPFIYAN